MTTMVGIMGLGGWRREMLEGLGGLVNISRSVEKVERKQRLHISKMGQELNIDGLRIDE